MTTVVLGVTSSVSIYKACEILRKLKKKELDVRVIMTRNATRMISPLLFSALSGHEVVVNPFEKGSDPSIAHVSISKEASLLLVAPATANIIGKFASGIADDFLSTFFMTVRCPVLVAPAMNEAMYFHKKTQSNIKKLKEMGVKFVVPERGELACEEEGWGRLADPEEIVKQALEMLKKSTSLAGKTFLITAASTREPLDPVRFLTNRSSGKMGFALAEEALSRGARVILVSGPTEIYPPQRAEVKRVQRAEEMRKEVLTFFPQADVVIMAAAVSDFSFASMSSQKLKKEKMLKKVDLIPTPDILQELSHRKRNKILVGFAAETEKVVENALRKMKEKKLDLIVANDVAEKGVGFGSDYNQVTIINSKDEVLDTEIMSKREISGIILDKIEEIIGKRTRKHSG
ncbi:MAG: bifunctional phosphopantothenoylcysteine decarboxylase/phosphopantothenate--cysteine ligase CoaBC [Candidatus Aminicenantales bacterium]